LVLLASVTERALGDASTPQKIVSSLPTIRDKGKAEFLIGDGLWLNTFFAMGSGLLFFMMIALDVLEWNRLVIYAEVVEDHG
jgi:hypothetical protein